MVLISAAFLLLNFRVAVSNTQADQVIVTMGDHLPVAMQRNDKIILAFLGEGLWRTRCKKR
jgi:hypothetical protein